MEGGGAHGLLLGQRVSRFFGARRARVAGGGGDLAGNSFGFGVGGVALAWGGVRTGVVGGARGRRRSSTALGVGVEGLGLPKRDICPLLKLWK